MLFFSSDRSRAWLLFTCFFAFCPLSYPSFLDKKLEQSSFEEPVREVAISESLAAFSSGDEIILIDPCSGERTYPAINESNEIECLVCFNSIKTMVAYFIYSRIPTVYLFLYKKGDHEPYEEEPEEGYSSDESLDKQNSDWLMRSFPLHEYGNNIQLSFTPAGQLLMLYTEAELYTPEADVLGYIHDPEQNDFTFFLDQKATNITKWVLSSQPTEKTGKVLHALLYKDKRPISFCDFGNEKQYWEGIRIFSPLEQYIFLSKEKNNVSYPCLYALEMDNKKNWLKNHPKYDQIETLAFGPKETYVILLLRLNNKNAFALTLWDIKEEKERAYPYILTTSSKFLYLYSAGLSNFILELKGKIIGFTYTPFDMTACKECLSKAIRKRKDIGHWPNELSALVATFVPLSMDYAPPKVTWWSSYPS